MYDTPSDDTIHAVCRRPTRGARLCRARRHASHSDALRLGIHPRTLYALRDSGEIEGVGRGLYRLATAPPLASLKW